MKNLNEEMGNSAESTMKIVEIKDIVSKMNFFDNIINILHTTEEGIIELEDRSIALSN